MAKRKDGTPISRTALQMMMDRLATKADYEPSAVTLEALARAANVSPGWLAFGEGTPGDVENLSSRDRGRRQFIEQMTYWKNNAIATEFLDQFDEDVQFAGLSDRSPADWRVEYEAQFRAWHSQKAPPPIMKKSSANHAPRGPHRPLSKS